MADRRCLTCTKGFHRDICHELFILKQQIYQSSNYFSIRNGFVLAKQKDLVMVQGRIIKEECLTFPPNSFIQILSQQNSIGSRRAAPERNSFQFNFCSAKCSSSILLCFHSAQKNSNAWQTTLLLRKSDFPALVFGSQAARDCCTEKICPPAASFFLAANSAFVLCQHPALLCVRLPANIYRYPHCDTQQCHS